MKDVSEGGGGCCDECEGELEGTPVEARGGERARPAWLRRREVPKGDEAHDAPQTGEDGGATEDEDPLPGANLERMESRLARNRVRLEQLAGEFESERAARIQAEAAQRAAEAETARLRGLLDGADRKPDAPAAAAPARGRRRTLLYAAAGILLLVAGPFSGGLWLTGRSREPEIATVGEQELTPGTGTGELEVAVRFRVWPHAGIDSVPAANAPMVLACLQEREDIVSGPAAEWYALTVSADGKLLFTGLTPGRYLLAPRPPGPSDSWAPLRAGPDAPGLIEIHAAQCAKGELVLVDEQSAIRGQVLDAESGKVLPGVPVVVSGDAMCGGEAALRTGPDGGFRVGPLDCTYGEFLVRCVGPPEGYEAPTPFHGLREPGVALDRILVRLSRKPIA